MVRITSKEMASNQPASGQFPIRGLGQPKCPDHQSEVVLCCKECEGQLEMASNQPASGQFPIRGLGQPKCPDHQSEVVLCCKECEGQLVCLECVTSNHQGHKFDKISDVATDKKQKIQDYVRKAERTELPQIKQNIESIDKQMRENSKDIRIQVERIESWGESLKAEIEETIEEFTKTCQEIKGNNRDLMSQYKQDLQEVYDKLCDRVDKFKKTINSGDNITVIDVEKDIQKELMPPIAPSLQTIHFSEGPASQLQEDIGQLSIQEEQLKITPQERQKYKSNDSNVVSEFKHAGYISSVVKSTSDSVWVSNYNDKSVSLVTLQGEVKNKLKFDYDVYDISVSPVTGNLWLCCSDNKTIYEVSGNETNKRFTTDSSPWFLCMTPDNSVVVNTDNDNVIVYNTKGEELHSTKESDTVVSPHTLTVCTSTGNIAVCDSDLSYKEGHGNRYVSVFNSELDLKFRYHGPPKSVMKYDFKPLDAVYDTQGHLLVADYFNDCIQLVSGKGKFLAVVHTDTLQPAFLTLIQDSLLCIGFYDDNDDDNENTVDIGRIIKVIKYKV